jgi:hypothetical protein
MQPDLSLSPNSQNTFLHTFLTPFSNESPGCPALLVLFAVSQFAFGQAATQQNLDICLAGHYPALCDYSQLTPEQLRQAHAVERRENLKVCMTGKYPALCDHSKLSAEESEAASLNPFMLCRHLQILNMKAWRIRM